MSEMSLSIHIPYALDDLQRKALHVWITAVCSHIEKRRPYHRRNQYYHDLWRDRRELLALRLQLWMSEEPLTSPLHGEIQALYDTVRMNIHDYWEVTISDGRQLQAERITNAARPFTIDLQAFRPWQWQSDRTGAHELRHIMQHTGAVPKHRIRVNAVEDDIADRLLLAYTAAELAQEHRGWVQLQIAPQQHSAVSDTIWALDATRELIADFPGTAHEIHYGTHPDGSPLVYHLVDADFLRHWAEHPRFALPES